MREPLDLGNIPDEYCDTLSTLYTSIRVGKLGNPLICLRLQAINILMIFSIPPSYLLLKIIGIWIKIDQSLMQSLTMVFRARLKRRSLWQGGKLSKAQAR